MDLYVGVLEMIGLIGDLSSGKTAVMIKLVKDILLEYNYTGVIGNINLYGIGIEYQSNEDFLLWYLDTMDIRNKEERDKRIIGKYGKKIFLIDEIGKIVPSRKFVWTNEIYTDFLTMLGKIDCLVIWTSQLYESQVDKIYRDLSKIIIQCTRIDLGGNKLILEQRIVNYPIRIRCNITIRDNPPYRYTAILNPENIYKNYNTKELIFLNFDKLDKIKKRYQKK